MEAEFDTVDLLPPDHVSADVLRECSQSRDVVLDSDVPARPESRKPAQAEPIEAKLCEAVAGLGVACGSGFTSSKP